MNMNMQDDDTKPLGNDMGDDDDTKKPGIGGMDDEEEKGDMTEKDE